MIGSIVETKEQAKLILDLMERYLWDELKLRQIKKLSIS